MVTVLCPVFNHLGYIRQCLESLVMQETDFVYEVIVRDDASTDGTDRIIREFAEKYPSVVRAVIERENMNGHFGERVVSMIRGEYVAFAKGTISGQIPGSSRNSMITWSQIRTVPCVCTM